MANSRSARKRIRSNERKHARNRTVRSAVRTKIAKARRGLLGASASTEAQEDLRAAVRALDRAAEKGVLHPNNARRRKARLASMAARLASVAAGEGDQAAARAAAAGGVKGRTTRLTRPRAEGKTSAKPASRAAGRAPAAKSTAAAPAKPARRRAPSA